MSGDNLPPQVMPVDPTLLKMAATAAGAAARYGLQITNPSAGKRVILRDDESGDATSYRITDHPDARMIDGIHEILGEADFAVEFSVIQRFFLLLSMVRREQASKWITSDPESTEDRLVHDVMFTAAAEIPLSWQFDPGEIADRYFQLVQDVADAEASEPDKGSN